MENPVMIFGANYLGRIAKEIFESNEVVVYGFLDDDKKLHSIEIDEAVVLGAQEGPLGRDVVTAEELAGHAETIPWEVLCAISRRGASIIRFCRVVCVASDRAVVFPCAGRLGR